MNKTSETLFLFFIILLLLGAFSFGVYARVPARRLNR